MANARNQPASDGEPTPGGDAGPEKDAAAAPATAGRAPEDPTPPDVRAGDPAAEPDAQNADAQNADAQAAEAQAADAQPTDAQPVTAEPVADDSANTDPAAADSAAAERAADTSPRVVFVETPAPPRRRGNRGVGAALALLGAVLFAVLYALGAAVLLALTRPSELLAASFGEFVTDAVFWVPILFFLVSFVLLILVLNRAAWWAHVLGSILVGLATYFGSIGLLMLLNGAVTMTSAEADQLFRMIASNPLVILSALGAREVAVWIGLAISARGRRVRARNAERQADYERELAATKAERERAAAAQA